MKPSPPDPDSFLVTGALGCIGAWVVRLLLEEDAAVTLLDPGPETHRLEAVVGTDWPARVRWIRGDVAAPGVVAEALAASRTRYLLHLAGLQVPACAADPVAGARVNVLGTLQVLEAAAAAGVDRVVYASSAAVYGPEGPDRPRREEDPAVPRTHYGVFKLANEGAARIAWQERRLATVGLRPLTVYGPGRDRGLTSGPTAAMAAALRGEPATIAFTGATDFLWVEDCAAAFVACARHAPPGARVYNLHGETAAVARFVAILEEELPAAQGLVQASGPPLPLPATLDDSRLRQEVPGLPRTGLREGIRRTLAAIS